MGTELSKSGPKTPLKPSHMRILKWAQKGPVLTLDSFGLVPLSSLPVKGAVAKTLIDSLQRRGLLDASGRLTARGHTILSSPGEC